MPSEALPFRERVERARRRINQAQCPLRDQRGSRRGPGTESSTHHADGWCASRCAEHAGIQGHEIRHAGRGGTNWQNTEFDGHGEWEAGAVLVEGMYYVVFVLEWVGLSSKSTGH